MTISLRVVCCCVCLSLSLPLCAQPTIGGCPVFPADNPWNQDVSALPVHSMSQVWVNKINSSRTNVHPDWGSPRIYGIPYVVVPAGQAMVTMVFDQYADESDPGPYPFPFDAPIEGDPTQSGDHHVLVIDQGNCKLYETWDTRKDSGSTSWHAANGAVFDLSTNSYRPDGWTSGDAAGLPIFPGLVRYDEVTAGEIKHAVRFTVPKTQRGWIHPARHMASNTSDTTYPPMGLRLRLKASYDISGFTGGAKVILTALKKYGMILADNGSAWFISGATDSRWDDNNIGTLKNVPGSAFEAVATGPVKHSPSVGVTDEQSTTIPASLRIAGPNPANRGTRVTYALDHDGSVQLLMFDMLGREMRVLDAGLRDYGTHDVDVETHSLPNGMYVVRMLASGSSPRFTQLIVAHDQR